VKSYNFNFNFCDCPNIPLVVIAIFSTKYLLLSTALKYHSSTNVLSLFDAHDTCSEHPSQEW